MHACTNNIVTVCAAVRYLFFVAVDAHLVNSTFLRTYTLLGVTVFQFPHRKTQDNGYGRSISFLTHKFAKFLPFSRIIIELLPLSADVVIVLKPYSP